MALTTRQRLMPLSERFKPRTAADQKPAKPAPKPKRTAKPAAKKRAPRVRKPAAAPVVAEQTPATPPAA